MIKSKGNYKAIKVPAEAEGFDIIEIFPQTWLRITVPNGILWKGNIHPNSEIIGLISELTLTQRHDLFLSMPEDYYVPNTEWHLWLIIKKNG